MNKQDKIRIGLYRSSGGISMTAMIIVAVLELFMLAVTAFNPALYVDPLGNDHVWQYRSFYIFLLAVALIYIVLRLYVKGDIERRFRVLNVANPLCAVLFYAWALAVTFSDFSATGIFDPTLFITFSLVVPLSFYMAPSAYAVIVAVADALLLWIILSANGGLGVIINSSVFFVFQIVLGVSYLRIKTNIAERIVEEQENALIDVLTGCPNRRAYENEIGRYRDEPLPDDLAYIAMDLDSLKEINDSHGHEAGDRLIVGAAQCIKKSIGDKGEVFRVGGDEFAALIRADDQELKEIFAAYHAAAEAWSEENVLQLSASYGCACRSELTDEPTILALARMADGRMYQAKAEYYQKNGYVRR